MDRGHRDPAIDRAARLGAGWLASPAIKRGFDPAVFIAGTVDEVAARFRELGAMGYTDVLVRHLTNDQPKVLGSLACLAEMRKAVS